jgi:hypothetical protein
MEEGGHPIGSIIGDRYRSRVMLVKAKEHRLNRLNDPLQNTR